MHHLEVQLHLGIALTPMLLGYDITSRQLAGMAAENPPRQGEQPNLLQQLSLVGGLLARKHDSFRDIALLPLASSAVSYDLTKANLLENEK